MDIRYRSPLNRDVAPAAPGEFAAAAHRPARGLAAGRARADGGRHQPAVPHALPPVRRRALRERDDHGARARRGQPQDAAARELRARGDDAQPAALRRRPALRRRGGAAAGRRGPRRPPRHELRLPGAQGDEQGRRRRDPAQAEAAARRSCAPRSQPPGACPVTIKFRIGIDDRYQTYLEAGRIAQEEGCAAVGLHARTAAQLYDGEARWEAIARAEAQRDAHPGARQRRHLGGRGRAAHDAHDRLRRRDRRPRLPGPAVAVPRPRERLRRAASPRTRRASAASWT